MDRELKLLYELLLKLGVTFILAAALFGVYMLMARKRAKKAPHSFFTVSVVTLALYVLLILNESELFGRFSLWEGVYLWTKFAAYLGTAFLLLKAMDILLLEDYLIIKKGLYIPDLLRLLLLFSGLAVAGIIFLRSEEHTSELQSPCNLVCRLLLEKKKKAHQIILAVAYTSTTR